MKLVTYVLIVHQFLIQDQSLLKTKSGHNVGMVMLLGDIHSVDTVGKKSLEIFMKLAI